MKLRLRAPRARSVARHLAVVLPAMALVVAAGAAVFALSGSLGAGIASLFVLFVITWVPAGRLGTRLDYHLDGAGPAIVLEPDALLIPQDGGPALRLPRVGIQARVGWYSQRAPSAANPIATGARGLFLHLRAGEHDLVLHGDDALGDVARRGVQRFTSPPKDKERPELRVWVRELLPLAQALGACG